MKYKVGDHVVKRSIIIYGGDWLTCQRGVITRTKRKTVHVQFEKATVPIRVHEDEIAPTRIIDVMVLARIEDKIKRFKEGKKDTA